MKERYLKILLVNGAAYPQIGGVENSLRYIGKELLKQGHEVKIWCFQTKPEFPLITIFENIEIIRMPIPSIKWPHKRNWMKVNATKNGIIPFLNDFKPDVIWSRSVFLGLGIALSGYECPLFQIYCTNALMEARGSFLNTKGLPLKRRIMMFLLFFLDYFSFHAIEKKLLKYSHPIFFSKNMSNQMRSLYKERIINEKIVYPGVNTDFFNNKTGNELKVEIFKKYSIDDSRKKVLYVGRLALNKNIFLLIDSIKLLKTKVELILVGEGKERERIKAYAKKKDVYENVRFVGLQDKLLPGFYSSADVTVLPTTIESFGQVYLESLACGTPVIGFKGDGKKIITATNEIIKDGLTGRLVEKVSASDLAKAMESIFSLEENDYKAMSENAIRDVSERFTWKKFVKEMLFLSKSELSNYGL
ncbi:MAG: glycosyltransferase [Candidatus Lokiarchaeota archaeon]|nr:glycosyltransferase [Candidatus Lokiarchaeota archaeon]